MTAPGGAGGAPLSSPPPAPPCHQAGPRGARALRRLSACSASVSARNRSVARGAAGPGSRGRPALAGPATTLTRTIATRVLFMRKEHAACHASWISATSPLYGPHRSAPAHAPPDSPRRPDRRLRLPGLSSGAGEDQDRKSVV